MRKKILIFLTVIIMIFSLILVACNNDNSSEPASTETTQSQETTEVTDEVTENSESTTSNNDNKGDLVTFTVAIDYIPDSLRPSTGNDSFTSMIRPIYDLLFVEQPGGGREFYLADSLDVSEDGLTYTVTLKDDIMWSDGEPITTEDIVFAVEVANARTGNLSSYAQINDKPVEFNKVDDKVLEILLPEPYGYYATRLASLFVLPSHAFEGDSTIVHESDYFTSSNPDMVTSGPFKVAEFNPDSIVYVARDDYYRGQPNIDRVILRTISEGSSKQLAFESGEISYMRTNSVEDLEKYKSQLDKYNIVEFPEARLNYLQLGAKSSNFDWSNEDARKAIFFAIDPYEINELVYGSDELAEVANSLIVPEVGYYKPEFEAYEQNIEEATRLAEETGLTDVTLKYVYNSNRENMEAIATVIQQQLARVGINVEVQGLENATFFSDFFGRESDNWDLGTNGWDSQRGDRGGYISDYTANSNGRWGFSEKAAELGRQGYAATTQEEANKIYAELHDVTISEYWEYPLNFTNMVLVSHKEWTGLGDKPIAPEFIDYMAIKYEP